MNAVPFQERYPKRPCAVCGSVNSHLLFRQTFFEMSSGSLLQGYDVAACSDCGFCFADHIPTQDEFDVHYRDMSKYEYQDRGGQETEHDRKRFEGIADSLIPFLPDPHVRLLDVGCATGRLLALFMERGFKNVLGIDPSPVCSEGARRLYDVTVVTGPVAAVKNVTKELSFGCIILAGVLEHMRDMNAILGLMREMLAVGGLIFIEVPDAVDFAKWPDAPYQEFSTEHINFFSSVSLENLMRCHGFVSVLSKHEIREQTVGTVMPVVTAIFRKEESVLTAAPVVPDTVTAPALTKYIEKSRKVEERIHQTIQAIVDRRTPVIVWGVGTHTLHLLATGQLGKADIRAFVDSNPRYHGKRLNEIPILSPQELKGRSETILISSRVFQAVIEKQIREELCLTNETIKLYDL